MQTAASQSVGSGPMPIAAQQSAAAVNVPSAAPDAPAAAAPAQNKDASGQDAHADAQAGVGLGLSDGIDDETVLLLPDGDRIAACEIEKNLLNALPCISHALVFGSKRPILAAFLVLKSSDDSDPNLPLSPEGLLLAKQFSSPATTCR